MWRRKRRTRGPDADRISIESDIGPHRSPPSSPLDRRATADATTRKPVTPPGPGSGTDTCRERCFCLRLRALFGARAMEKLLLQNTVRICNIVHSYTRLHLDKSSEYNYNCDAFPFEDTATHKCHNSTRAEASRCELLETIGIAA